MVANPDHLRERENIYRKLASRLREVREKTHDPPWIYRNEAEIRALVLECLNRPPLYHHAVHTLDRVLPLLKGHRDYVRWNGVVDDAIFLHHQLKTDRSRAALFIRFGELKLQEGNHLIARKAADIAQAKVVETDDIETQVRAYTLFFQTQVHRDSRDLKRQTIYHALRMAKRLSEDHPVRAGLYQSLAWLYSFRRNLRASRCYTRKAFRIWRKLGSLRGRIQCAVLEANIARVDRRYTRFNALMAVLERQMESSDALLFHAQMLYTRACVELEQDRIDAAIVDYTQACQEFIQLQALPQVATCHQALALAYATNAEFRRAKLHLAKARRIYRESGAQFRLIDSQIAQSYIARCEGRRKDAARMLDCAATAADGVVDRELRSILQASIRSEAARLGGDAD